MREYHSFISRKDRGDGDAKLRNLALLDVFEEMETRKATILKVIEEAGALTEELRSRIENSVSSTELEDLYLPWRPKRRTRATIAKELGLEPLADMLMDKRTSDPYAAAKDFVNEEVPDVEQALPMHDILAERASEPLP